MPRYTAETPELTRALNATLHVRGDVNEYERRGPHQVSAEVWTDENIERELAEMIQRAQGEAARVGDVNPATFQFSPGDQKALFFRLDFLRYLANAEQERARVALEAGARDKEAEINLAKYFRLIGRIESEIGMRVERLRTHRIEHHLKRGNLRRHQHEREVIDSEAYLCQVRCIQGFDPRQGEFSTYFTTALDRIYTAVNKELAGRQSGERMMTASFQSDSDSGQDSSWMTPEASDFDLRDVETLDAVTILIAKAGLDARERDIITLVYEDNLKHEEIGRIFNVSKARVGQILAGALEKLKRVAEGETVAKIKPELILEAARSLESDAQETVRAALADLSGKLGNLEMAALVLTRRWKGFLNPDWIPADRRERFHKWNGEKLLDREIAQALNINLDKMRQVKTRAERELRNWAKVQMGEQPIPAKEIVESYVANQSDRKAAISALLNRVRTVKQKAILCLYMGWEDHFDLKWVPSELRSNFADWNRIRSLTLAEVAKLLGSSDSAFHIGKSRALAHVVREIWMRTGDQAIEPGRTSGSAREDPLQPIEAEGRIRELLDGQVLTDAEKAMVCLMRGPAWRDYFDINWIDEERREKIKVWKWDRPMKESELQQHLGFTRPKARYLRGRILSKVSAWEKERTGEMVSEPDEVFDEVLSRLSAARETFRLMMSEAGLTPREMALYCLTHQYAKAFDIGWLEEEFRPAFRGWRGEELTQVEIGRRFNTSGGSVHVQLKNAHGKLQTLRARHQC